MVHDWLNIIQTHIHKYAMGAEVTIDKHTTAIDQWLELCDKLEETVYEEPVQHHVSVWRFFSDDISQEVNCLPLDLNLTLTHNLLSPHQTYLVLAIQPDSRSTTPTNSPILSTLVHAIANNITQESYSTSVANKTVGEAQYHIYAYVGRLAKPKLKLQCISTGLKLHSHLCTSKQLAIFSSGGAVRNKKLQKGSTLPLLAQSSLQRPSQNPTSIPLVELLLHGTLQAQSSFLSTRAKKPAFLECPGERKSETRSSAGAGVKPPLLKLTLKPFEEVTYEAIEQQQKKGEIKFDIRATARHELKMTKFKEECSEIVEGLFVSGEKMAKSWQSLQKYEIKAVVNCAGDYCQNWFEGRGLSYMTFFLKDSQNQNIECLFYRVIDFVQAWQQRKGNVLIHCIQGISRSVTMAIAYCIFKFGYDYKKAEQFVKGKRGIACPNNGFMVELIQFHKRLYEPFSALHSPRVFLVSSHSKETPGIMTARMLKQPLFESRKYIGFDSRGVYVIQTEQTVNIWVGSKCEEKRLKDYWGYAQEYIKKLQKYERAPNKLKAISQGTEGKEFFSMWGLEETPPLYENPQYTRLFSEGPATKPGGMRKLYERQIDEEQEESPAKLFIYPDYKQGLGVFELDDLMGLSLVCHPEGEALRVFICKEKGCEEDDEATGSFLDSIIKTHYASYEPEQIMIEEERIERPSQELMSCFA